MLRSKYLNNHLFYVQAIQLGLVYAKDSYGQIMKQLSVCTLKKNFFPRAFEISLLLFFVAPMSVITVLYILIGIKLYKPNLATPGKRKPILITTAITEVNNQHIKLPDSANYETHSKSTKRVVKMLGMYENI